MIQLLATIDVDGVIGVANNPGIMWNSTVNNKFIGNIMRNQTLVVGNTTYKRLRQVGENSTVKVLSRTEPERTIKNVQFYNSIGNLLRDNSNFTVIGGRQMYELFLPIADVVLLSTLGINTNRNDCLYFPTMQLETFFEAKHETEVVKDKELLSGITMGIIFSKWERKARRLH